MTPAADDSDPIRLQSPTSYALKVCDTASHPGADEASPCSRPGAASANSRFSFHSGGNGMNKSLCFGLLSMSLACAVPAVADDAAPTPTVKSPHQKMNECISRQRAANSAMTKADARKACARET